VRLSAPEGLGLIFNVGFDGAVLVGGFETLTGGRSGPAQSSGCVCEGDQLLQVGRVPLRSLDFCHTTQLLRDLDRIAAKVRHKYLYSYSYSGAAALAGAGHGGSAVAVHRRIPAPPAHAERRP
jgi:hypothetical protein